MKRKEIENSSSVNESDYVSEEYCKFREYSLTYHINYVIKSSYKLSEQEHGHLCPVPVFSQDKTKKECLEYLRCKGECIDDTVIPGGKKKFFTSGYQKFKTMYLKIKKGSRYFYETILPHIPCHLYIDVEMYHNTNPKVDMENFQKIFEKEIIKFLIQENYINDKRECDFIILDSSNLKKFSKHYIIKIKGKCFRNNFHCGALMRKFHNYIIKEYGSIDDNPFFFWDEKEKKFEYNPVKHNRVFIVDMGVYTSGRQFRLYGSSKESSPERILLLQDQNSEGDVLPDIFLSTLIQRVEHDDELISCLEENGNEPESTSDRRFFLSEQTKKQKLNTHPQFNVSHHVKLDDKVIKNNFPNICGSIMDFIDKQLTCGGRVEKCDLFYPNTKTMCISTGSKYCLIRGDYHKSNHIYYIVNLQQGIYYQKCHDEDCRGKSKILKIEDQDILNKIDEYLSKENNDVKSDKCINAFLDYSRFICEIDNKKDVY